SLYQHNNDNSRIQNLVEGSGYPVADGSVTDGETNDFSIIMGANLDNGRGNVTTYVNYRKIDAVLQADRDYSSCALGGSPGSFSCSGSPTTGAGRFTLTSGTAKEDTRRFTVNGDQLAPFSGAYNHGPTNYYQRPNERWTMGAFGHYDLNDKTTVYTQLMYADDRTVAQIAPSGAFGVDASNFVRCDNPFLSDQQFDVLCGQFGLGKENYVGDYTYEGVSPITGQPEDQNALFTVQRRNIEGGPRQGDLRHTTFRGVFGVRGDINDNWSYDMYGQRSEVSMEDVYLNDMSNSRIQRSLDATRDPDSGDIVCRSALDGSDPNCVPWNIFQTGGVTQGALDYLILPLFARGSTEQEVFSGYVTGNLGDYGVKLPTADEGVAVVLGLESRRETLKYEPDSSYQSGDGAGQGGPSLPVQGSLSVKEIFGEANIPLLSNLPGAQYLGLEMAYRFSDYSTDHKTDTYKLGADWQPFNSLKVRASFQSATRHANIRELYRPQGLELFDMSRDPCAINDKGVKATATPEQCERTGLPKSRHNGQFDNTAGQYNTLAGGNPDLAPEDSETFTMGFVFSPSILEGLTLSIDYFNIEVTNAIDNISPSTILNNCLETGDPKFCDAVNRDATGGLWLQEDGFISSPDVNIGFFETEGFDLNTNYGFDVGNVGSVNLNLIATYLTKWDQQEFVGEAIESCLGAWSDSCGSPKPRFKSTLRATWSTPWSLDVTGGWRHIGSVNALGASSPDFGAFDYFDLATAWATTDNITLRGGINNIFDKEPPLSANAGAGIFGNGNTFPGTYDALGRYAFLGFTVDF
ncbi:MAG: TonB-dependent receptor, partial [Gammaproteobacteria bacterium]|nr:TonB-dependent receptor [Gammaproteobacteria bacterium]